MTKTLTMSLLVALLAMPAVPVQARGCRSRSCGEAAGCAPAPCAVTYAEQEVTAYRAETRTRVVPVTVNRMVSRVVEQPYKYTETVSVVVPETRTITTYACVARQVPFTYTVNVPVTTQEKRTVTYNTMVAREVPYTYTVNVPIVTPQKQVQTYYTCVPEQVAVQVPVCRTVTTQVLDTCTGCYKPVCQRVTEMQTVNRTVMRQVAQTREVTVNVCSYQAQQRTGSRTVCDVVPQTREVMVNVCSYQAQERSGTRTVMETVPQTQQVTVNTCKYQQVERTGVSRRVVCETVQETVNVTQTYCEMVPYKTTVRVPVAAGSAAPCAH